MNSLLQTLFFLNKLRFAVYQMPIQKGILSPSSTNVAYALQSIFYNLQFSKQSVDNVKLLNSLEWNNSNYTFGQQDVQEFCRLLLTNIEDKMRGTNLEGTISKFFEGITNVSFYFLPFDVMFKLDFVSNLVNHSL